MLEQDVVNKLEPGMSKTQVRYVMGTPMVTDVFHQERWDYVYTDQPRGEDREQKRMTLFFDDNRLVEVVGDIAPQPGASAAAPVKETVVSVPDLPPRKTGLISRALLAVGVDIDE